MGQLLMERRRKIKAEKEQLSHPLQQLRVHSVSRPIRQCPGVHPVRSRLKSQQKYFLGVGIIPFKNNWHISLRRIAKAKRWKIGIGNRDRVHQKKSGSG